jgi:putative hydroxymethylpyrimidine transporter CytX
MNYLNAILIWFGAAISIAEILTGTLFAPLGLKTGIIVIILGHIIGCLLMYLVGIISTNTKLSTMKSTARSFGKAGGAFFASLNGIQLIGWTAVMIFSGSQAANILLPNISIRIWSIIIALLIILWLMVKFKELKIFPIIIISLLYILSIIISKTIFKGQSSSANDSTLSFFSALELAIAMPLSWLPLIGDYTNSKTSNKKIPLLSSVTYFFASSWMYIIGLGCAIFAKESNFALILLNSNMGIIGILIIVLSTITTTFLDAFSCGVSFSVFNLNERKVSIICVLIGLIISLFWNQNSLESFLYLISSVFVPMAAIQITDYFLFKKDVQKDQINYSNIIIFIIGFILYRLFLTSDFFLGISIPTIIITSLLVIIYNTLLKKGLKNDN